MKGYVVVRSNQELTKGFPFLKMAENHSGVPMHLKKWIAMVKTQTRLFLKWVIWERTTP